MVVFALAALTVAGLVQLWHVYAAAFLLGAIQALNMPTRMAMVADLVVHEDIMNAVSLNSTVMNLGLILGPFLAGGIIDAAGIGPALAHNASFYFLGIFFLVAATALTGLPILGLLAGAGGFFLAAASVGQLLLGAILGGLWAQR